MASILLPLIAGPLVNQLTAQEVGQLKARLEQATPVPFSRLAEGRERLEVGDSTVSGLLGTALVMGVFAFIRLKYGPKLDDVGRHLVEACLAAPALLFVGYHLARTRLRLTATTLTWGRLIGPWTEVPLQSVREARFHLRRLAGHGVDEPRLSVQLDTSAGPRELPRASQDMCLTIARAIPASARRGVFSEW